MSLRDIPRDEWSEFFDQFSRGHRAWLATVDRVNPDSVGHTEVTEQPLSAVVPRIGARGVDEIEIRFQQDSHAHEAIRIERPMSVRVDEAADGAVRSLEVVDDDGQCTRVRFRAAPLPEMLDGIAPGELSPS
jgi:hypothetical protein